MLTNRRTSEPHNVKIDNIDRTESQPQTNITPRENTRKDLDLSARYAVKAVAANL